MKNKKILAVLITVVMILTTVFSGCSLVSVDPEKDSAQTLMTIGDETITKSVFNNYMAYLEIYYTAAGYTMPTGSDLEEVKDNVLETIVQTQILAAKGKIDGLEVDEAEATESGEEAYEEMKESAENSYETILSTWNTNDESFKAYMIQNSIDAEYAEAAQEAFTANIEADPEAYFAESVGTVNDEEVTRGEYHYYFIQAYLNYYMSYYDSLDTTDDALMKETNTDIFNTIGMNRAMIAYCEENDIAIEDEDIETQQTSLETTLGYFFEDDDAIAEFVESFNMTLDQYREYQKEEAKANAAESAIQNQMQEDAEVTDAQIQSYYNKNKTDYDPSTVSACHILTEDKDFATEIYQAAKDCTTKEAFESIMAEYEDNENVSQAMDLGAFTYSEMVEAFSKKAFSMNVDTVSLPTETDYGYHIIYVYDKNEVTDQTWEDYSDEIKALLQSEKGSEAFEKYQTQLEKNQNPVFDNLKIGIEAYIETLKTELNVTINEKVI